MWENTKPALYQILEHVIEVDEWTSVISIYNLKLCSCLPQEHLPFGRPGSIYRRSVDDNGNISVIGRSFSRDETETNVIDYWSLFVERCKAESINIQKLNWIDPDDVLCFSSTATVAIPGVTIGTQTQWHLLLVGGLMTLIWD